MVQNLSIQKLVLTAQYVQSADLVERLNKSAEG